MGAADLAVVRTQMQENTSEILARGEAQLRANIGGAAATTPMVGMQVRALVVTAAVVGSALVRAAVPACISSSYLTH